MAKVVLALSGLSIPDKVQKVRQFVTKMTGNASFPTPDPPLADVTAAVNKLESDYNDAQGKRQTAQAATNQQNLSEAEADRLTTALGGYVDGVAKGDDAKILSAGMSTKAAATPVGPLPAVSNLSAAGGDMDGEVDLNWQPLKGAKSYTVVKSTTGNVGNAADWTPAATGTKSKATVGSLTSGTRYWFRVAAIGSAGQGPWSDPATAIAS
jgi:hypothetical protein